jgi:hypothetical protein
MSADRPISKDDVAVLLASALGQEKSIEIVTATVRSMGINRSELSAEDVRAVFEKLVQVEGLVGVVARYAISRGDVEKLIGRTPRTSPSQQIGRPAFRVGSHSAPRPTMVSTTVDIVHLLAPALGAEKAREAIEHAASRRGVDVATGLSHAGALAVLDEMAKVEGIVGVVARFAKARFLLNPNG